MVEGKTREETIRLTAEALGISEAEAESNKFSDSEGMIATQCCYCKHQGQSTLTNVCSAFPDGIPDEILVNDVDHRKAFLDPETGRTADRGIRFTPRDDVSSAVLTRLYTDLDEIA
jgi:hypothetical protein